MARQLRYPHLVQGVIDDETNDFLVNEFPGVTTSERVRQALVEWKAFKNLYRR